MLAVSDQALVLNKGAVVFAGSTAEFHRHEASSRATTCWSKYDVARQVLDGHFIFVEYDAAGAVVSKRYVPLTLRSIYHYEMQQLLERSDFAVEALYGDFVGGRLKAGSAPVWLARRA